MSKDTKEVTAPAGSVALASVRIRTGGVHFSGARIVTLLTLDQNAVNLTGSNVIVCTSIRTHPAGVLFEASPSEGGGSHIVPYANVEVMTVA